MILTLTLNPAVDLTYIVPRLRRGQTNRVMTVTRRAGGKGINVASVLKDLGADSLAVLPLGGASGREIVDDLTLRGVDHVVVSLNAPARQTIAVVEPMATTNFSEPGLQLTDSQWQTLVSRSADCARRAGAVVISGSVPPGISPAAYGDLVRACSRHAPVLADVSGEYLASAARAGAAVLAPNDEELSSLFPGDDVEAGARELIALGADSCLVSLGSAGLRLVSAETEIAQSAVAGVTGNTTGAGDAALAAFALLRYEHGLSRHQVLIATAGATAVTEPVAGALNPTTYRTFISTLAST